MLERMDSAQFARWWEFYCLEPWGSEADDFRAGVIASTTANFAGKVMKGGDPAKPSDFFPSRTPEPESNVESQLKAIFGPMVKEPVDGD